MTNPSISRHLRFAADLLDAANSDIDAAIDYLDRYLLDDPIAFPIPTNFRSILDRINPSDSDIDTLTRILDAL